MNDISHIDASSDMAILKEIGLFIKQKRVEKNINQNQLAYNAAISRSTLSLIERGENISLINLIKIMRILDLLYLFDQFKAVTQISPLLLAKEEQKQRKRASNSKQAPQQNDVTW